MIKKQLFSILGIVTILIFSAWENKTIAAGKGKDGVTIGVITYSFRSMPDQSLTSVLNYAVQSNVKSVELMGDVVERFAGLPSSKDALVIKQWRSSASMDRFKEVRKMFNSKGININILKLGDYKWTDEEIDYAFGACKALGAKGISMEISEEAAKRMEPFAEKHKLYVIFHNHGQPGDPNFSFDKVLAYGPKLMLNLDAGHYFGATGKNPCDIIERLHDRIVSIHIKDKTGPKAPEPNKNQQFGEGQTPIAEILKLLKKNKWPITCDIELEYEIPQGSDAVKEVSKCFEFCKRALLK